MDALCTTGHKQTNHCFGNPIHVAEAYKSSLRSWSKINDGDNGGIQDFADFLVRCEEAMKTMQSMGDLNLTETLRLISSKLPSYSAVKWCRHAHEAQTKSRKIVTFRVSEQPYFLTGCLKGRKEESRYPDEVGMERQTKQKGRRQSECRFFCDNNHSTT